MKTQTRQKLECYPTCGRTICNLRAIEKDALALIRTMLTKIDLQAYVCMVYGVVQGS